MKLNYLLLLGIGACLLPREGALEPDFSVGRTNGEEIQVSYTDGGHNYPPDSIFNYGDSLELRAGGMRCYYVEGIGFLEVEKAGRTDYYLSNEQGIPELSPCYHLLDGLEGII